jgi:hypothetical protein
MVDFVDTVETEFPVSDFHTALFFMSLPRLGACGRPVSDAANLFSYSLQWLWYCLILAEYRSHPDRTWEKVSKSF